MNNNRWSSRIYNVSIYFQVSKRALASTAYQNDKRGGVFNLEKTINKVSYKSMEYAQDYVLTAITSYFTTVVIFTFAGILCKYKFIAKTRNACDRVWLHLRLIVAK